MPTIRQRTLDILDRDLSAEASRHAGYPNDVRFRLLREVFSLDRTHWDKYYPLITKHSLTWNEFKYTDINRPDSLDKLISTNSIGLYLFVVRGINLFEDMPKYVFYVGMSGEDGSNRPLKDRLKDYFNLNEIKKRKKVHRMLQKYHPNVYVKYATTSMKHTELEELEVNLHGFFHPIADERDFPVDIKHERQADLK